MITPIQLKAAVLDVQILSLRARQEVVAEMVRATPDDTVAFRIHLTAEMEILGYQLKALREAARQNIRDGLELGQ